jgi:hypothetical protein
LCQPFKDTSSVHYLSLLPSAYSGGWQTRSV